MGGKAIDLPREKGSIVTIVAFFGPVRDIRVQFGFLDSQSESRQFATEALASDRF
jgi:hypothetical protein